MCELDLMKRLVSLLYHIHAIFWTPYSEELLRNQHKCVWFVFDWQFIFSNLAILITYSIYSHFFINFFYNCFWKNASQYKPTEVSSLIRAPNKRTIKGSLTYTSLNWGSTINRTDSLWELPRTLLSNCLVLIIKTLVSVFNPS